MRSASSRCLWGTSGKFVGRGRHHGIGWSVVETFYEGVGPQPCGPINCSSPRSLGARQAWNLKGPAKEDLWPFPPSVEPFYRQLGLIAWDGSIHSPQWPLTLRSCKKSWMNWKRLELHGD